MNIFSIKRTKDDDMTGVNTITKKALHHLTGHRVVSMQEGVHMVDDQELVICSDSMTYVSITQGQVLRDDTESDKKQDIITVYRNRTKNTEIFLLSNSFTESLLIPHSKNQTAVIQMIMMEEMLLQTVNIEYWFPRE
jgi:hypothetical protein